MAAVPIPPFNPYQPIPNNQFYYPPSYFIQGVNGPLVIGSGLTVNYATNVISATGGGGSTGTVTSITAGTGLTGGTITVSGTIGLADTTVIPGTFSYASFTVDQKGRITAASSSTTPVLESDFNAVGDLLVGTGVASFTALGVGADGTVLTADAACTSGVKWAAGGGAPNATPSVAGVMKGCTFDYNTTLGGNAGVALSTGIYNTLIGCEAAVNVSDGCYNTVVGGCAGFAVSSSNYNTLVGHCAGVDLGGTGGCNVFIGTSAGFTQTDGGYNVAIGPYVDLPNTTGDYQLAIGFSSGANFWLRGDSTKAIQPGAGIIDCAGSCGSLGQVLASNGANAIEWVPAGGAADATPTVAGVLKGCTNNAEYNTLLGADAGLALTVSSSNVLVGQKAGYQIDNAEYNTFVGRNAGQAMTSGCYNTFIGGPASFNQTSGSKNVAIGSNVELANATGSCQLVIGFDPAQYWLRGDSTKAIQPGAGIIDCAGVTGTAGQVLASNGANAIEWVAAGGAPDATPAAAGVVKGCTSGASSNTFLGEDAGLGATGDSNVFIGTGAASVTTSTSCSVAIGVSALAQSTNGQNIAIGHFALSCSTTGLCNTAIGPFSMCLNVSGGDNVALGPFTNYAATANNKTISIGSGTLSAWTGNENIAIGYQSMNYGTGTGNLAVGTCSLSNFTTGNYNTVLGTWIGKTGFTDGSNNVLIGYNVQPSAASVSNEVTIGNSSNSSYRIYGTWSNVSDARDKKDVENLPLGLQFIKSVRPVKYVWDYRDGSAQNGATDIGFIAQELLEAQKGADADYAHFVNETNPEQLMISPTRLIPVLVKAIQELSERLDSAGI